MKKLLFFLLLPAVTLAGNPDYDGHFEADGAGGSYSEHYDETAPEKPINPMDFYEDHTEGIEIPSGVLDTATGKEKGEGQDLGSSISGRVTGDKALSGNVTTHLQNGTEMETLGDTFFCPTDIVDNYTEPNLYPDKSECDKSCMGECRKYTFTAAISCQNAEEVIKVSAVNPLAANTPLRLKYRTNVFTTPPVTAICGNGFISGGTAYEWVVSKDSIEFLIPDSRETLGECRDMTGRAFMASFTDIYSTVGMALNAHVSELGFIASHSINDDMTLSVNVIVAGACGANSLQSGLPNSAAIEKMKKGELSESEATMIAQSDENYKLITSGKDYKERACTVSSTPVIITQTEPVSVKGRSFQLCTDHILLGRLVRKGSNVSVEFRGGNAAGFNPFENCPADPAAANDGWFTAETFSVPDTVADVRLNYSVREGGGCTAGSGTATVTGGSVSNTISCPGDGGQYPQITYSYEYEYQKDDFNVRNSDGCSSIPKDCKLMSESICDNKGGNCIKIRDNGIATGAKVQNQCSEMITSIDKYNVCSDGRTITAAGTRTSFSGAGGYFTAKKEYSCASEAEEYDYTSFLEQSKLVSETAKLEGDDYSFKGRGMDGSIGGFSTNISLKNPECPQTCKVKALPADNGSIVLEDGKLAGVPTVTNPDGTKQPLQTAYYKSCNRADETWTCPIEAGETLVADCACDDDFTDTVLQLQFVSESAKNMKCSSK